MSDLVLLLSMIIGPIASLIGDTVRHKRRVERDRLDGDTHDIDELLARVKLGHRPGHDIDEINFPIGRSPDRWSLVEECDRVQC